MNSPNTLRKTTLALAVLAGVLLGAPASAQVVGSEGWVQATAPGTTSGEGYLILTNKGEEQAKGCKFAGVLHDSRAPPRCF